MHPETIRRIDSWIGKIACFFLTYIRRIIDVLSKGARLDSPTEKILFLKLVEQGASVLAYPAICQAVGMVGKQNVYFCVFEDNRPILDILNIIPSENILSIRHSNFLIFSLDTLKVLCKIRRLDIDATVDMEFFARASAILSYLTGAKKRVGLHRFTSEAPYRGDLMTHRIQYNPYLHTAQLYELLVEALTSDPDETPLLKIPIHKISEKMPKFVPDKEEAGRLICLIEKEFGQTVDGPIVLLNPNASDMLPLRKWPAGNFVNLANRILIEHENVFLILTGAPSEQIAAQSLCSALQSDRVISLAGNTSLRDLLVLYSIADVLVTNDSGPGHFAALTDIDSIVLFGPETPRLFGAIGENAHIIYADLACSPCVNVFNHRFSPCRDNICMSAITVDEVYEKVKQCLENKTYQNRCKKS